MHMVMSKKRGEWDSTGQFHLDSTSKGKRRLREDLELLQPCVQRPLPGPVEGWLQRLSLENRVAATRVDNAWAACLLRQMLGVKLRDGEVLFTPVLTFPASETRNLEDYFVPVRPESPQQPEALALEHHLRFMDNSGYINSVGISRELASDFPLFLRVSAAISGKAFLKHPCYARWESGRKQWIWECPHWASRETFSLSQFALTLIEKAIWTNFYQSEKLELRAPGEVQIPPPIPTFQKDDFEDLSNYWENLSDSDQFSLAGDLKSLISLFDSQQPSLHPLEIASSHAPYSSISFLSLFHNPSEHYSALRSQVQHYMVRASVDLIRRAAGGNAEEFVEWLLRSPIERAGTALDIVAREVAGRIREKQREQAVEDLLREEPEKPISGKQQKKKKKAKKRRIRSSKENCALPRESAEQAEGLAREILELIVLKTFEQTDNEEFQTVQSRRRYEKPNKSPILLPAETPKSHFEPKICLSALPKKPIIVIEHPPQPTSLPFQPDCDFPPLSTALLTKALQAFTSSADELVARRQPILLGLIEKLQSMVSASFPGSFLSIYGSHGTGLSLPSSDLDLVILNSGVTHYSAGSAVKELEERAKACPWVHTTKGISTASVPVLKLALGKEGDVDLTFDDVRHSGLAACAWVADFLRRNTAASLCLRILKQLLVSQSLHCAYLGGLCSYSLVLWMAVYCSICSFPQAGDLLMGFLSFYGIHFDPKATAVYGLGYVPIAQASAHCETWDPLNSENNTTKGAYRVAEVQALFRRAYGYFGGLGEAQCWRVDQGPLSLCELGKI